MTDCIRSLLNCSHLKVIFILSNITFHYQSYFKIVFSIISTNAFLRFLSILADLQGNWNKFSIISKIIKLKNVPRSNTTKISIVSKIKGLITKFHFRNDDQ